MGVNTLFRKYEKQLKLRNINKRFVEEEQTFVKTKGSVFKVPRLPKQERTFHWIIDSQTGTDQPAKTYSVKFTPRRGKKQRIPEQMYSMKRCFQQRRDGRIALSDATFQPEKQLNKLSSPEKVFIDPEYTENELRQFEEFHSFFESWDDNSYSEDDCLEIMEQAVMGRIEVYQEVYKQTSNPIFLAKAVFIKFLDLESISTLHRMYIMLTEESEFPMSYVERILRKYYE